MTTYRVIFEVELPDSATEEEVDEFIKFNLGSRGDMDMNNPLSDIDLPSRRVRNVMVGRS